MENWYFKRIKFTENGYDSYRKDLDNLNLYEYRYLCILSNNESYLIRILINYKYTKFYFNFQNVGTSTDNIQLHASSLAYPTEINENEHPSQLLRLQFVLHYLKSIFPTFRFEEEIEV
jgi:hypothetical protein